MESLGGFDTTRTSNSQSAQTQYTWVAHYVLMTSIVPAEIGNLHPYVLRSCIALNRHLFTVFSIELLIKMCNIRL